MKSQIFRRIAFLAIPMLAAPLVCAMDMRFDVATDNNNGLDTDWFGSSQLPALNFPSVDGHNIEQGGKTHQSTIQSAGNTLGVYYDTFDNMYSNGDTPATAVSTIQSWITKNFGSTDTGAWLVLNEVNGSVWNGSSGNEYRTWLVNTMSALNSAGYTHVILYSSQSLASKTYASTWQALTQYAYIGAEMFIDGPVVQSDNYSVSKLQKQYQTWYNAWTSASHGAGIPASKLIAGEHFSVNQYAASTYWGADGISGTAWEQAIEARDIAIHNIPFGGFIGYAWDKDAQATGNATIDLANQIAYEKAYASTLTVQTEVPAWTGNDGSTSWNDYLNWTGGLPSTTADPFPLLAATNPTLARQTAANFLTAIKANTTITLDGNQSITNLTFDSPHSYTIVPGTGGSLTITGSGASIGVTSGSHFITAGLVIGSDTSANLAGSVALSGSVINNGYTLTKSGTGTLTISGPQTNSANSAIAVSAGTLLMNSDAGSSAASPLAYSASGGTTIFNSAEHLSSVSLTGGHAAMHTQGKYLLTHSLAISNNSQIDVAENDVIDDYTGSTPLSTIQGYVNTGYNNGAWNGADIVSTSALSHPNTTLGVAEASTALGLTGSTKGSFDGQSVDATTVLVKFTWIGDANLDGVVNAKDASMIQLGGTTWSQGDFNHDGIVNQQDVDLFDQMLGLNEPNISSVTGVPEPVIAPLLLIPLFIRWRLHRHLP